MASSLIFSGNMSMRISHLPKSSSLPLTNPFSFRTFSDSSSKSSRPPLKPAPSTDKASEAAILEAMKKNFSDHLILGEEGGLIGDSSSDYLWCIEFVYKPMM